MKNHLFAPLLGMASITALWAQRDKLLPLVLPLKQVILPAQEQSTKVATGTINKRPSKPECFLGEITSMAMPPKIFLLKPLNQN